MNWNSYTNSTAKERQEKLDLAAQQSGEDFLSFNFLLDMFAYHGETAVLSQLVQSAWPHIKASQELSDWQKQAFTTQACDFIIFNHIQTTPNPTIQLKKQLEQYYTVDEQQLAYYLAALTQGSTHEWKLIHFDIEDPTPATNQQASQNLAVLMIDFLAHLHLQEKVSLTKGNFVRHELPVYFVERRTGQLQPRQDLAAVMRGERPRPIIRPKPHPLCPDKVTLEKFFANQLNYQPQPYQVAATFTLIPAWLRFLQSRQLIDGKQQEDTLNELQSMAADLQQYFVNFTDDPTMKTAVKSWNDNL